MKCGHSHFKSAFGKNFGLREVVKLKLRHLRKLSLLEFKDLVQPFIAAGIETRIRSGGAAEEPITQNTLHLSGLTTHPLLIPNKPRTYDTFEE